MNTPDTDAPQTVSNKEVSEVLEETTITYSPMGPKTMVCLAKLPNGFEVVTTASCVDPDGFDTDAGKRICQERLREKLFELIGFQRHPDL